MALETGAARSARGAAGSAKVRVGHRSAHRGRTRHDSRPNRPRRAPAQGERPAYESENISLRLEDLQLLEDLSALRWIFRLVGASSLTEGGMGPSRRFRATVPFLIFVPRRWSNLDSPSGRWKSRPRPRFLVQRPPATGGPAWIPCVGPARFRHKSLRTVLEKSRSGAAPRPSRDQWLRKRNAREPRPASVALCFSSSVGAVFPAGRARIPCSEFVQP